MDACAHLRTWRASAPPSLIDKVEGGDCWWGRRCAVGAGVEARVNRRGYRGNWSGGERFEHACRHLLSGDWKSS